MIYRNPRISRRPPNCFCAKWQKECPGASRIITWARNLAVTHIRSSGQAEECAGATGAAFAEILQRSARIFVAQELDDRNCWSFHNVPSRERQPHGSCTRLPSQKKSTDLIGVFPTPPDLSQNSLTKCPPSQAHSHSKLISSKFLLALPVSFRNLQSVIIIYP